MKGRGKKGFSRAARWAGLVLVLLAPAIALAAVARTKHNFGSLSPATVKTTESTEICVFCHTPHNSNPTYPLWNRGVPGDTYDIYESQTIVATMGQPTGSSKLCLSCHDGTIAIGSLLNLPGPAGAGVMQVTGPGIDPQGRVSTTSTSYIGTDLKDDHPISFDYSLSYPSNVEVKDRASFPPEVRLDRGGRLQCTSCHDPHGTNYPKFLARSYEGGSLCAVCHDKRYWNTMPAVHRDSTTVWNGTGLNPWHEDMGPSGFTDDTPQLQSCLACHRSHGGSAAKSLLKGTNPVTSTVDDEEWTCLVCHNGNAASKNVEAIFNYTSRHDVKGTYGLHVPSRGQPGEPARESATNLGTNRHAECADCHNPHGAMAGNHTIGGINGDIIAQNVLGSWGVKPTLWPLAGEKAINYTVLDFTSTLPGADNLEGYLCIKCHSYYAYGEFPPNVPSGNADGTLVKESDITADFNVNNKSFHPVFTQGMNRPPSAANPNWPANGLGLTNTFRYLDFPGIGERSGFYRVQHDSTMTCTDCHGPSTASDPQGPHGSNNRWITRSNETGVGSPRNFCYNCHRRNVYGDEGYIGPQANFSRVSHPVDGQGLNSPFYRVGPKLGNDSNKFGILCLSCHGGSYDSVNDVMKGVHGSNAGAGPLAGSDDLGYRMMNGACVESHKRATTAAPVEMTFRTINPITEKVCNDSFSGFTGNTANYNCNTVGDCSN